MNIRVPAVTETSLPNINRAIRDLAAGRSNATGTVTLAVAPATSTTVTAPNIGYGSIPYLTPMNAAAATEAASGSLYVSPASMGSFVIHHSSSAGSRSFGYGFFG